LRKKVKVDHKNVHPSHLPLGDIFGEQVDNLSCFLPSSPQVQANVTTTGFDGNQLGFCYIVKGIKSSSAKIKRTRSVKAFRLDITRSGDIDVISLGQVGSNDTTTGD
jgi:hypothetical protein